MHRAYSVSGLSAECAHSATTTLCVNAVNAALGQRTRAAAQDIAATDAARSRAEFEQSERAAALEAAIAARASGAEARRQSHIEQRVASAAQVHVHCTHRLAL